jgi:hypothetical protein
MDAVLTLVAAGGLVWVLHQLDTRLRALEERIDEIEYVIAHTPGVDGPRIA